jgi:hypothetical protein
MDCVISHCSHCGDTVHVSEIADEDKKLYCPDCCPYFPEICQKCFGPDSLNRNIFYSSDFGWVCRRCWEEDPDVKGTDFIGSTPSYAVSLWEPTDAGN